MKPDGSRPHSKVTQMVEAMAYCALVALAQPNPPASEGRSPATWTDFYREAAKQYRATLTGDAGKLQFRDQAIFDWASINEYHGAVFAWRDRNRPSMIATIFSFPLADGRQRLVVHEFASFAEAELAVGGPGGIEWKPPRLTALTRVPEAAPPPASANLLKLQCRRLAADFSASLNRRGERWDLRLLPTPLIEYQRPSDEILGGGLFAFVGYSTDPEILMLVEARQSIDGPGWYFHPVRFSDKSLYLYYRNNPIWQSLRTGHGTDGPDTDDPLYRVLHSERLPADVVAKLSPPSKGK
jgi:hypothetical protein